MCETLISSATLWIFFNKLLWPRVEIRGMDGYDVALIRVFSVGEGIGKEGKEWMHVTSFILAS